MKKVLFLLVIIVLIFAIYGCKVKDEKPLVALENIGEKSISYKIEKIILSKGFQSTEPSVEILKNNNNIKLMASLGLIESSGISVEKVTRDGNNINIYIDRLSEKDHIQLAIPQVVIELQTPVSEKTEKFKFNIINQNYDPIPLKFGKNQILNKIYTNFKITPNTIPTVNLTRLHDKMLWDISFNSIFDKENAKAPLVNLNVQVDANTGEILNSQKDAVSTYIDDGYLLDYIPNNYLLYKQQHIDKDNNYESLWSYNLETGEHSKLYTSKDKIASALYSPDSKYISLIEVDGTKTDLYIIPRQDKVAYKITPINHLQPRLMKWQDNTNLYFIDIRDNNSTLLSYNIEENISKIQFTMDMAVEDFDFNDNLFLFVEPAETSLNKKIYLSRDGLDMEEITTGFKATFFDNNNIIYLKNIENEDKNILQIYNFKTNKVHEDLDYNITNYFKLNEENIIFVEKNTSNNDYTLTKYGVLDNSITPLAKITNDRIFYDSNSEKGYTTLTPPFDNDKKSIIYSIDLNKLKSEFN